jgi:hypothetical protein
MTTVNRTLGLAHPVRLLTCRTKYVKVSTDAELGMGAPVRADVPVESGYHSRLWFAREAATTETVGSPRQYWRLKAVGAAGFGFTVTLIEALGPSHPVVGLN